VQQLWQNSDGTFTVPWLDETQTRVQIRVGPTRSAGSEVDVEWGLDERPAPWIESVSRTRMAPGGRITLRGQFGVESGGRPVVLTNEDGFVVPLDVESWFCDEIRATIPESAPVGEYRLTVFEDSSLETAGNWIPFKVRLTPSCGLGAELAVLIPLLALGRRRLLA
jgi:hypothetical protein